MWVSWISSYLPSPLYPVKISIKINIWTERIKATINRLKKKTSPKTHQRFPFLWFFTWCLRAFLSYEQKRCTLVPLKANIQSKRWKIVPRISQADIMITEQKQSLEAWTWNITNFNNTRNKALRKNKLPCKLCRNIKILLALSNVCHNHKMCGILTPSRNKA